MLSLLTLLRTGIAPTRLPMSPSALRLPACCCTAFAALWLLLLLLCCCFPVPAAAWVQTNSLLRLSSTDTKGKRQTEKTKRESKTVILRLEGGMGLPPCCSTCFLFSSATVVCCYFHPTHACTNNKPISYHFSGIFLITQPGTLLKPKLPKTPATFLLAIMPWNPPY